MHDAKSVEALAAVMAKYGLSKLKVEGVELERPLHVIEPPPSKAEETVEPAVITADDFSRMSPDAQDRMMAQGLLR